MLDEAPIRFCRQASSVRVGCPQVVRGAFVDVDVIKLKIPRMCEVVTAHTANYTTASLTVVSVTTNRIIARLASVSAAADCIHVSLAAWTVPRSRGVV